MAELVAAPVADSLVQSVIGAVKKEIKYVLEYKTYVKNLKEGLADLDGAKDQVQHAADKALDNAEKIENAVTTWINEAENATKGARDLLEKNDKSKKSCFRGIIPNLSTRFQISKKAEEITEKVTKLKDKRALLGDTISYHGAPLGRVTGTYTGANYHVTKSREYLLKEINKAFMDSTVRIVGVSGRSGVGKSVLMKQVEKQVLEKKLGYNFEQLTIVTVGQTPNLEKIQDEMAGRLGLKFDNEKGVELKAHRLSERLKQNKETLMIFDDLWKKLDLDKLGIPQSDGHSHIKILLTSRNKEMLMNDMNSKRNLMLEPLDGEEAVELFEKIVRNHINDVTTQDLLQKQLVEGCAGLPVFIAPLATKLKRLPLSSWNDALRNLKRSDSKGMKKFVEETLGINYEVIEAEEVKALFLLCGQMPSQIIPIDYLLIYGMGLGFLKGDTIEECRVRLMTLLESLKSNGLLEEETSNCIKIHDLVSEVSLSIAKRDHHSLVLQDKKSLENCSQDDLKICKFIIFPYANDIHKLPEEMICPELDMFLFYTEDCPLDFPDSFFNGMRKLKVLDVSGVVLTALPSSIELLDEIHTLCLDQCRIEDLRNIRKLKQLKMLTFSGSEISRLPKEIGELIHLRLLDLNGCYRLEVIEPDVLGSLTLLEELALPDTFNRWDVEGIVNASLNELNNLSCLSCLKIHIPDVNMLPHDLPFGNLKKYKILIGGQSDCFMQYDEERTLVLKLNSDNSKIVWEDWVQATMQSAQKICLLGWRGIEKGIIELSKGGFLELKHIDLQYSPTIRYIFRPNERFQYSLMESLYLYKLANLEKIYQGSLTTNSFTNLKSLRIIACHKLRNLFSISLAKALLQIEEIKVEDCKMISEIITFDSVDDSLDHKGGATDNKLVLVEFRRLRTLKLSSLPNISSFCAKGNKTTIKDDDSSQIAFLNGQQVSFPSLESLTLSELPLLEKICHSKYLVKLHRLRSLEVKACKRLLNAIDSKVLLQLKSLEQLTIKNCESMKSVFDLDKLTTNEATKSLKRLQVSGCEGLKYLFSSSMAKLLQGIAHVSISDCKTMERIFLEEKDDTRDTVVFSSLTELWISDMESLTMFSSGNHCLEFPYLKQIEVRDCPKMSTFVPSKNEKKLSRIGTFSKNEKRLLRTTTTQDVDGVTDKSFFSAKAIFPSLEKLVLSSIESLTNIWEISLPKDSFCKLASIEIEDCEKLQTIFPLGLVGRLQNLMKLEVYNCEALEVLFACGEQDLMMPKLKDMSLCQLPNLKQLVMIKSSSRKAVLGFPNLTDINLDGCHGLVDLFPNTIARTLFELENLEITSCSSMVEVFSTEAEDEEVASLEDMTFSNLCSLKLGDLDNLTSFCTGHAKHYFPFLKELSIIGCTNLKAFVQKPLNSAVNEDESTPLFDEKVIVPNLQQLQIQGLNLNEIWHNKLPARFFCKLKVLMVEGCNEISVLIPSFMMNNLQSLDSLIVTNCDSLEVIFELEERTFNGRRFAKSRSWKLKTIKLSDLPSLKCICKSAFFSDIFPFHKLVSLKVESCKLLTCIFPVSMVYILEELQKLSIKCCESLEQVIEKENDGHSGGCKKIVFSHLSSLKLFQLPKLVTFCAEHTTEWPTLQKLEIRECEAVEALVADSEQHFKPLFLLEKVAFPKIESLIISEMSNLKHLWHTSKEGKDSEWPSDAFCNLTTLQIDDCNSLLTILSSKVIKGFQNLEELLVENCSSLEQVFQVQGNREDSYDNGRVIDIDFSLRELQLSNLPIMKQIWIIENPEGVRLSFKKLQSVNIKSCNSLKHLFPASVAKYLHQLEKVNLSSCIKMEEIISRESNSTKNYANESANCKSISFPKATYLWLKKLPKLKSFLYGVHSSEWPSLEIFEVFECPNVKILAAEMWNTKDNANSSNEFNTSSDKQINLLDEENISSLKSIKTDMASQEDGQFPYDFFNLANITLSEIEDEEVIKKFPWTLLLEKIHNIEILEISRSSFEELFPLVKEEAHGHVKGEEEDEIVRLKSGGLTYTSKQKHALGTSTIQSLRKLRIEDLHKLKHVWKQDSIMADILNMVESLIIWKCHSLTALFPASASFLNLTKLDINKCDGMVHLVTSSAVICLVQLTDLEISVCGNMEHIVIEEQARNGIEGVNVGASVSFPRLKALRLFDLEKLESFSSTTCYFNFPSLESVDLSDLPALKDFCKGGFTAPILHEVFTSELEHQVNFL